MVFHYLSFLLLAVGLLIFVIDLIPIIKTWLGRVHIGRYNNQQSWSNHILNVAIGWIGKTPKIKATDQSRLIVLDILKGNYTKPAIQSWQKAGIFLGIGEYLSRNEDVRVMNELRKSLNDTFAENGRWKERPTVIDGAIYAYSIMKLDFIDRDQYRPAWDQVWELIHSHIGKDGTVQYRKFMENYRYVDTIGFICPFLVAYGIRYKKTECVKLAINQIEEYQKHGMLEHSAIPFHAYNLNNRTPQGLYGWGRGVGWFAVGLMDTWNELPDDHEDKVRLKRLMIDLATDIIAFQQENGGWNWSVTRSESRTDSSTTAILGWFLVNAAKIAEIAKPCLKSAEKAIYYLMKVTRRDGAVDFSQGDTKDIGVYSMTFDILPFTQGFSLRLINSYMKNEYLGLGIINRKAVLMKSADFCHVD